MAFLRFCSVGVLNTLVGFAIIFGLMRFGGVQYLLANATGYASGMVLSFTLNRSWTFAHKGPILHSALQWTLVIAVAYAANISVVFAAHEYFGELTAIFHRRLGVLAYTGLSFLGGRYFAFSPRQELRGLS